MAATDEPRSGARAVDRAIAVLNCFDGDDPELSVSELAQQTGLPVSTTHRLLQALVRGRLLEQDHANDRYRIGHGLASLARPALTRLGLDSAAPHLYALAANIRISVSLSVPDSRDALTVFQARPPVSFCPNQIPRPRRPLRSSAAGHALLAFSPGDRLIETYAGRHESDPPASADLDRVRRAGFAVEVIDSDDPIRSIAVPIVGRGRQVRGALCVQARSARLDADLMRSILPPMRHVANRIGPLLHAEPDAADTAS
ncbi:IclR family transcriptional regulator [Nocardia cerradoensis]|uniref:Glycerol operon regulatory protein n=1 Tax=Nocardia cerradoensis TaxID=85688 RepID=A0A231HAS9_9NOCA|nr:IclR family transcriptional regulator [Nocardia cerradoensis]NKY42928.1 IclR family transcriptional regulator [Nocardia cerradoensis]OXR45958.1 HTH-type transcriptional regulator YiaJ [Nocardia cerradoensis]